MQLYRLFCWCGHSRSTVELGTERCWNDVDALWAAKRLAEDQGRVWESLFAYAQETEEFDWPIEKIHDFQRGKT